MPKYRIIYPPKGGSSENFISLLTVHNSPFFINSSKTATERGKSTLGMWLVSNKSDGISSRQGPQIGTNVFYMPWCVRVKVRDILGDFCLTR